MTILHIVPCFQCEITITHIYMYALDV